MKNIQIAAVTLAFVGLGIAVPQTAGAAVKIHPTNVKVDKSCNGTLRTKLITGINYADKYGKLQTTKHPVTVFCDHTMAKDAADGTYSPERNPIYGDKVNINAKTGFATMSVIHELGHYLDYERYGYDQSWAPVKVSDKKANARQAVREADVQTVAWATWVTCRTASSGKDYRDWCDYASNDTELFARGYAQYVAQMSGDKYLLKQIRTYSGGYAQWGNPEASTDANGVVHKDDFAPLFKAYSKL